MRKLDVNAVWSTWHEGVWRMLFLAALVGLFLVFMLGRERFAAVSCHRNRNRSC